KQGVMASPMFKPIGSNSGGVSGEGDNKFDVFYKDLKETEKRDSVLTSKQQIDRLLRPGASYANLNPFEVLQVDPKTPIDEIKKKFRRMSILVHPDKNQDDSERAQKAFDELTKAWRCLENESTRQKCLDIVEEAEAIVTKRTEERKKQLKREGKDTRVDEDDPEKLKRAVYVQTMKLFADMERKRRQQETRDQEERKRKRDLEIEEEEQRKAEKEWQKNFEESRVNRVNSWKDFQKGKSAKKFKGFKPPKHKAEARD
ncbi:hypothetical protein OTU49_011343, partial [Cherax quadricarinatus]